MKVILLQDVDSIGKAGDIKEIRNGYGFNFLLPQGLAEFATPQAIKQATQLVAKRRQELEKHIFTSKEQAALLTGKQIVIKMKARDGKLFGSVGRKDIVIALSALGITVDTKNIILNSPIKKIGTFPLEVHFGQDVNASFDVVVNAE